MRQGIALALCTKRSVVFKGLFAANKTSLDCKSWITHRPLGFLGRGTFILRNDHVNYPFREFYLFMITAWAVSTAGVP